MRSFASFFQHSGRFIYLLGSLLGLLLAGPVFENIEIGGILFNVMLSVTLLASIYAISHDRRFVLAGIVLATVTFASAWFAALFTSTILSLTASFMGFLCFQYTAGVIVVHVFKAPSITADELLAAVSAYLMLGIGGGFIFQFLEVLNPDTLLVTANIVGDISGDSSMNVFIYYSFTCLTTLGFGDIIPGTPQARIFSYISAVIGQMFLTILIARFVGLHISQFRSNR